MAKRKMLLKIQEIYSDYENIANKSLREMVGLSHRVITYVTSSSVYGIRLILAYIQWIAARMFGPTNYTLDCTLQQYGRRNQRQTRNIRIDPSTSFTRSTERARAESYGTTDKAGITTYANAAGHRRSRSSFVPISA